MIEPASARPPIPFTILGGFLGAGKTTLINRLLAAPHGLKLVVLVNDFGAVNIDAALIAAASGDTIALSNGCACCAVGDDFGRGILMALARTPVPDQIVVEASGVADPAVLAEIAGLIPELQANGTIVLADAANLSRQAVNLRLKDTIERQLAAADLVILTKTDRASADERTEAEKYVATMAPRAARIACPTEAVPMELVLGALPRAGTRHDVSPHAPPFAAMTLVQTRPVDAERLVAACRSFGPGVVRAKGFVRIDGEPAPRLLQMAGRSVALTPAPVPTDTMPALVLIAVDDLPAAAAALAPLGFSARDWTLP